MDLGSLSVRWAWALLGQRALGLGHWALGVHYGSDPSAMPPLPLSQNQVQIQHASAEQRRTAGWVAQQLSEVSGQLSWCKTKPRKGRGKRGLIPAVW